MRPARHSRLLLAVAVAALTLLAPAAASAATVVNGDFEAGNLRGWQKGELTEAGAWFAYSGTKPPIGGKRQDNSASPVQAPPQGEFAAIADEANPDTLILFQDVALDPGQGHLLSLLAYYDSYKPIAVPAPDTLSVADDQLGGQRNQQFRIDVVRPEAALDSLAPGDVLATVFATRPGAPTRMKPTRFTADLSAFAGQTVRLRIAVAATEEVLNAGVDAVALDGNRGPGAGNRTRLGFAKARPNRANGSVVLPVRVPGPGLLSAAKKRVLRAVIAKAGKAGTVRLRLRPTAATLEKLERRGKLRVKVPVTFLPANEPREVAAVTVVLRLARGQNG
jgi:hypothetical protein